MRFPQGKSMRSRPIESRRRGRLRRCSTQGAVDITLRRFPVGTLGGVQAIDRDVRDRIRRATAELTGATTALRGGLGLEDLTQVALFEPAARAENEIVLIRRAQGCVTRIAERDI